MAKPSAKFFPNSHKPMIQTDKIAVVILNWNGRDMMRRFLPSVVRHSADLGLVVVADNGSTDGSLEMLEAEFPEVERLPLPQNYGFAAGYNEALRQIDAPYYLLLNSDVEVTEGWPNMSFAARATTVFPERRRLAFPIPTPRAVRRAPWAASAEATPRW